MADPKLEEVKKEVRSLLICYQKGTSFSEFLKEYHSMIGRPLPFIDFNFKDAVSFLSSMPDVVKVFPSHVPGDYHLFGIADKSVAHIQKMVIKQKTSKHRVTYRMPKGLSNASNYAPPKLQRKVAYTLPPRFSKKGLPTGVDQLVIDLLNFYRDGLQLNQFMDTFCHYYHRQFTFKEWGFSTLEECLETIPGINARNKHNDIFVYLTKYLPHEYKSKPQPLLPTPACNSLLSGSGNTGGQSSSKNLTSSLGHGKVPLQSTSADYFHRDFKQTAKAEISNIPASSTEDSNNKNENFLLQRFVEDSHNQQLFQSNTLNSIKKASLNENKVIDPGYKSKLNSIQDHSKVDTLDDFQLIDYREESKSNPKVINASSFPNFSETENNFDTNRKTFTNVKSLNSFRTEPDNDDILVSEIIKSNLKKVMERYPHGIFAVQFKNCYEEVINSAFDLHSLGFSNLSDFVDAVPDVLVRKPLVGSKKDWLIYSAKSSDNELGSEIGSGKCSVLFVECVILNIRKILQAYAVEGIRLNDFIRLYSFNCKEPLHLRDLGFDNLENFLLSIAPRVPLRIIQEGDEKFIRIEGFEEVIKPPVSPSKKPCDIVSPVEQFKTLQLPSNFDYTKYVPVYTSSIANPGLLYIQLEGDGWSEALKTLYDQLDVFYNGELSDEYKLKPEDLKENIACVALWPVDKHWYRAKITKIISPENVQVFYIDYGTTDEIPVYMLRYIKTEYMQLPVQALKSRLAYLKPLRIPGQDAVQWDRKTRRRMLQMCQDKPLMAKIENIKHGVLALILCDTNGDNDIYINDVLADENLAELCNENEEEQNEVQIPSPILPPSSEGLAALQYLAKLAQTDGGFVKALQTLSVNSTPELALNPVISSPIPPLFMPAHQQSLNSSLINSNQYSPESIYQQPLYSNLISSTLHTAESLLTNNHDPLRIEQAQASAFLQTPLVPIYQTESDPQSLLMEDSPRHSSSPDDMAVFDDDDDEFFEKLYQDKNFPCSKSERKKCFVKRVKTADGYTFHILLYDNKPHVSSGDVSVLIWSNKKPSNLYHRIHTQELEIPSITLMETNNEEFFLQLRRFHVKGIETFPDSRSSILIYPLDKFNYLLNIFGHPSATLRSKICSELLIFNPCSPYWFQECPESEIIGEIEEICSATDDDKLNRLCLYDLKTMKEGIRCKRLHLIKHLKGPELEDEISKVNQLFTKVRERIVEVEQLCKMYSNS